MRSPYYSLDPFFYIKEVTAEEINTFQRSYFDWSRSLKKALSAPYEGILFPENLLQHADFPLFIEETKNNNLKPVMQIYTSSLTNRLLKSLLNTYEMGLNVIFHDPKTISEEKIRALPASFYIFTYIVLKKNMSLDLSKSLPKWIFKETELYFPYKRNLYDSFLTPKAVYKYIKKFKPFLIARPYTGDIYDDRIGLERDLEPITKPFITNKLSPHKEMDFSVIIPSYNNKTQLINTLKQLTYVDYEKERFEIIVIDDGSSDDTFKSLKTFVESQGGYNFTAIHFPRVKPRKPGDASFRAGIARNLGVKYASGKYLAFLDGDILVPPNYLNQLKNEHEQGADLVQLKRYHLKKDISVEKFSFDYNKLKPFIFIEDKNYWRPFYEKGFEGIPYSWKYTCTYGLSLSKKEFLDQGRFGKTFLYYGFEDTDLGYRLFQSGKKLLLSRIKCYHQFVSGERQEDQKNRLRRNLLLAKTAKIFFYRHLDPLVFEELRSYMGQERGLKYFSPFATTN